MDKFEAEGDASTTLKKRWLLDFANKTKQVEPHQKLTTVRRP